jgi:hypothetical protein
LLDLQFVSIYENEELIPEPENVQFVVSDDDATYVEEVTPSVAIPVAPSAERVSFDPIRVADYPGSGAPSAAPKPIRERRGFFGKLFDFEFHDYITPSIVKIVFVLAVVVAILMWLLSIIGGFASGRLGSGASMLTPAGQVIRTGSSFNAWPGILAILFGWIPPLIWLIFARIGLEAVLSLIRTSKETRRIRHLLERNYR